MFIELTDHLRCPAEHDEAFLVLLPELIEGRSVRKGTLGCPICDRRFTLRDGVFDASGAPVPQARIFGLAKRDPIETPFSYVETYGDKAHGHPLYGEHFAMTDVPEGSYTVGTDIGGKKVFRKVVVAPGKLTWVVFKP